MAVALPQLAPARPRLSAPRSTYASGLPAVPGLVAAGRALPCGDGPGGDWYDLLPLSDGVVGVVVGDVMGHDAAAAEVMAQLRSAVRAEAGSSGSPSRLLQRLDDLVDAQAEVGPVQLATALYGRLVLDHDGALLLFGNAGQLPPLLRGPDGRVTRLTGALSPVLGAGAPSRADAAVCLPLGSTLLLYTDGLVERRHADLDDAVDILAAVLAGLPADARPVTVLDAVLSRLTADASDDVAVLALQVTGR